MRTDAKVRTARAQALLELALCAPLVIVLALGTVATVRVAGARAGLEAATQAAASAAARAPDPLTAAAVAQARFSAVVADYPMQAAVLLVSVEGPDRTGQITASSSAHVDLGWAPFVLLPSQMTLRARVILRMEPWRTHRRPG